MTHPKVAELAYEWDPSTVTAGMHDEKEWVCPRRGEIFKKPIFNMVVSSLLCPDCANFLRGTEGKAPLSVTHPEIASMADGWDPSEIIAGSGKVLSIKCGDCRRTRRARISVVVKGGSKCICKNSFGGSLEETHPEIAREAFGWDPSITSAGSNIVRKWNDGKCGHMWEDSPNARLKGAKCRLCSGSPPATGNKFLEINGEKVRAVADFRTLAYCYPELAKQLVNPEQAKFISKGSKIFLEWKCPDCYHKWFTSPNSRAIKRQGCPKCATTGFDGTKPAYIYFVKGYRESFDLTQYGITRNLASRLKDHRCNGFEAEAGAPFFWFEIGENAKSMEALINKSLTQKGVISAKNDPLIIEKFSGWSETFRTSLFSCSDLAELVSKLEIPTLDFVYEVKACPKQPVKRVK